MLAVKILQKSFIFLSAVFYQEFQEVDFMEANNLNQVPNKVSFAKKIGYSIGGATDTLAYDFVAAFLLFFLTNFTGVSPAWAGAILTIGVIWNMFSDPIVGNLSDRTRTRFGKKRTWLLIAIIPLFVSYLLLFTKISGLSSGATNVYFLCMTLLFWLSYSCFSIPYYSMGASMTGDNEERTKIRMLAQIIQYIGVFFSTVAPTMFVSFLSQADSRIIRHGTIRHGSKAACALRL